MEKGPAGEALKKSGAAKAKVAGALITVILLVEVLFASLFFQMSGRTGEYPAEMVNTVGNVKTVGSLLYGQYLFPFEIASLLLLVGIVGAVVIAKRK
jgi:NADH-quinone oxidoreductase subunit J